MNPDRLIDAIHAAGITPAEPLPQIADGRVRRFSTAEDKPRARSGWIQIFDNLDGSRGAKYGDHRQGITGTWFSGRPHRELTAADRREYAEKMAADRRRLAEAEQLRHRQAAEKAAALRKQARPAPPEHQYLLRKQVQPHGLRLFAGTLVVTIRDIDGNLTSLQFISPDGTKRFLSGGRIAGCYHSIGQPPAPGEPLLIAEGWATAATLHEATGLNCACAFSAGNLRPVAEALRGKYPQCKIIICADADPVGLAAAQAAAEAVGGQWIAPDFDTEEKTL